MALRAIPVHHEAQEDSTEAVEDGTDGANGGDCSVEIVPEAQTKRLVEAQHGRRYKLHAKSSQTKIGYSMIKVNSGRRHVLVDVTRLIQDIYLSFETDDLSCESKISI